MVSKSIEEYNKMQEKLKTLEDDMLHKVCPIFSMFMNSAQYCNDKCVNFAKGEVQEVPVISYGTLELNNYEYKIIKPQCKLWRM